MKWKCNRCGHEQPRHPDTKSSEMPLCSQYVGVDFKVAPVALNRAQQDELLSRSWEHGTDRCNGVPIPVE